MEADTVVTCFGDGTDEPYGLFGGQAGKPNRLVITPPGGGPRQSRPNSTTRVPAGSVVEVYNSGGGGYGPPEARPAGLVGADVRNRLVSPDTAPAGVRRLSYPGGDAATSEKNFSSWTVEGEGVGHLRMAQAHLHHRHPPA